MEGRSYNVEAELQCRGRIVKSIVLTTTTNVSCGTFVNLSILICFYQILMNYEALRHAHNAL